MNNLGRREEQLLGGAIEGVSPYGVQSARDCFLIEFGRSVGNRRLHPELVQRMRDLYTEAEIARLTDLAAQGLAARLLRDIRSRSRESVPSFRAGSPGLPA